MTTADLYSKNEGKEDDSQEFLLGSEISRKAREWHSSRKTYEKVKAPRRYWRPFKATMATKNRIQLNSVIEMRCLYSLHLPLYLHLVVELY
ncbi:MAG: hypothetical protein ACRC80_19980 [Waterburya sp.]